MRLFVACSVSTLVSRLFVGQWHGLPWGLLGWRVPVSFGRFDNMDYDVLVPWRIMENHGNFMVFYQKSSKKTGFQ